MIRCDGFIAEARALIEHSQAEVGIGGAAVETGRRKILLTGLRKNSHQFCNHAQVEMHFLMVRANPQGLRSEILCRPRISQAEIAYNA